MDWLKPVKPEDPSQKFNRCKFYCLTYPSSQNRIECKDIFQCLAKKLYLIAFGIEFPDIDCVTPDRITPLEISSYRSVVFAGIYFKSEYFSSPGWIAKIRFWRVIFVTVNACVNKHTANRRH